MPSPYDVMRALRQRGAVLLPHLLRMRGHLSRQVGGDVVQARLRRLAAAPG